MKLLKTLPLLIFILLSGTSISLAQIQSSNLTEEQKEEMAKNMEEFIEVLDLSEEQRPEFKAITKKYAEQMIVVRDGSGGKLQKYRKVKTIRKNKNAEMEKLLNKDQYDIYLEKQEEMQERMKEKRG